MFFVQDSSISSANPMEVLMPCTKPSTFCYAVLLQSAWCAFFTASYKNQCRYEHVLNDDHIVITTSFFFLPLLINTCLYVHMAIIARKQVGGRLQHLMSTIGLHYHGLLPHYAYMHTFFPSETIYTYPSRLHRSGNRVYDCENAVSLYEPWRMWYTESITKCNKANIECMIIVISCIGHMFGIMILLLKWLAMFVTAKLLLTTPNRPETTSKL